MRRFFRCDLATHKSGTENFDTVEFRDPSNFVIDTKKVAKMRGQVQNSGWTGEKIFQSAIRLLGHRAGFLKHSATELPALADFRQDDGLPAGSMVTVLCSDPSDANFMDIINLLGAVCEISIATNRVVSLYLITIKAGWRLDGDGFDSKMVPVN